jgi:hypothetical protein
MSNSQVSNGRIINNVTLAMPHANVFCRSTRSTERHHSAERAGWRWGYSIRAAAVSPSINVMCVNAAENEFNNIVYTNWTHANLTEGNMPGPVWAPYTNSLRTGTTLYGNSTAVDDIFSWDAKYGRNPPVFGMV